MSLIALIVPVSNDRVGGLPAILTGKWYPKEAQMLQKVMDACEKQTIAAILQLSLCVSLWLLQPVIGAYNFSSKVGRPMPLAICLNSTWSCDVENFSATKMMPVHRKLWACQTKKRKAAPGKNNWG